MVSRVFALEKEVALLRDQLKSVKEEIKMMVVDELKNCRETINQLLNVDRCQFCQAPFGDVRKAEVHPMEPKTQKNAKVGVEEEKLEESSTTIACLSDELLKKIIEKMDKKSLKNARLVCQSWSIHATSTLADHLTINTNNFFHFFNYPEIDILPSKITTGLVKHINWNESFEEGHDKWEPLTVFCEKYGTDVTKMNVEVSDFHDQLPFCKVLKEFCPNLEELYFLHYTAYDGDTDLTDGKYQSLTRRELPKTLALKRITFETFCHTPELNSFIEEVIKLCPNLEDLTIDGEIYSDLSNNKKLKSLKIVGLSHPYYLGKHADPTYPSFNIKKINQMLEQVHSTLETLILMTPSYTHEYNHINWSCIAGDDYLFLPFEKYMYNLKVFINKSIFIFPVNSVSRLLSTCNSLHTVELSGEANDEENMRQMFKSLQPNSSVTNLSVGEIEKEWVLRNIVKKFPSLRKLEFTIGKCTSIPQQKLKDKLKKFFEIVSTPKLDELKIIIKCKYSGKLSFVKDTLSYNQNFLKGLQSLTIENQANADSEEEFKDMYWENINVKNFKAALLRTRGMKRFELTNFHMRIASAVKIHEFVKKNKLPVHFLNR